MAVDIENRGASVYLELCELQTNTFLSTKETDVCIWKNITR